MTGKSSSRNVLFVLIGLSIFFLITTIVLSVLLGIFVHKYNSQSLQNAKSPTYAEPLIGYDLSINTTWDGQSITHAPINISLRWNEENTAIHVEFEAPLYNNPPAPNHTTGAVPELWNYEVVEIFIANDKHQYLEMELGPHNQWLCLLLDGQSKPFNLGNYLQLSVWNQLKENDTHWSGQADIPLAYLPANISSMNAYNIHIENKTKIYEAMSPAPYGKYKGPNFHRLQYFMPIDRTRLIPDYYFNANQPYVDYRYGDLWAGHYDKTKS